MEHVIVAFQQERACVRVREMLERDGAADCIVCRSAAEVKRAATQQQVGAIVCGYKFADQTAQALFEDLPPACAMLLIAPQSMLDLVDNPDIFRLPLPVSRGDLAASVRMLIQVSHRLARQIRPRRSQAEQAVVERAKAVLMAKGGMGEAEAHRLLQKRSMDAGIRLAQAARQVLDREG